MQKAIARRQPGSGNRKIYNFVNPAFRGEGYTVPGFDYQKSIFSRLLWTSKESVLRIVPGNDGSKLFPQNINTDMWSDEGDQSDYISDTFFMTYTLSRFGQSGYDLIAQLRPGSEEAALYPESPLMYFCQAVNRTCINVAKGKKTHWKPIPEWKSWTAMNGTCPFPRLTLLFQALAFTINGRVCKQSPEEDAEEAPLYGVIGINNSTSIAALEKALVTPMDRRKPVGPENNNFGALAEANGNVLYLNPAVKDDKHYLSPSVQAADVPSSQWEPTEYNLPEDLCMQVWQPWDKILHYLTAQEQIELIGAEFGYDTVNYIFGQEPEWRSLVIPDKIKAEGLGRYEQGGAQQQAAPKFYNPPKPAFQKPAPKLNKEAEDSLSKIKAAAAKPKALAGVLKQEVDVDALMKELDE